MIKNVKIVIIKAFKSKFYQYFVFTKKVLPRFVSFCISLIFTLILLIFYLLKAKALSNTRIVFAKRQPKNLKRLLTNPSFTSAPHSPVEIGIKHCSNKLCPFMSSKLSSCQGQNNFTCWETAFYNKTQIYLQKQKCFILHDMCYMWKRLRWANKRLKKTHE